MAAGIADDTLVIRGAAAVVPTVILPAVREPEPLEIIPFMERLRHSCEAAAGIVQLRLRAGKRACFCGTGAVGNNKSAAAVYIGKGHASGSGIQATVSAVTAIVLFMLPLPMEADRSALRSAGR